MFKPIANGGEEKLRTPRTPLRAGPCCVRPPQSVPVNLGTTGEVVGSTRFEIPRAGTPRFCDRPGCTSEGSRTGGAGGAGGAAMGWDEELLWKDGLRL